MNTKIVNIDPTQREQKEKPPVQEVIYRMKKPDDFSNADLERFILHLSNVFTVYSFGASIDSQQMIIFKVSRIDGKRLSKNQYAVKRVWQALMKGWSIGYNKH